MNKENIMSRINSNRSSKHPSDESTTRSFRPTIKVGYKVIKTQMESKRSKAKVDPIMHIDEKATRKKFQQPKALIAGNFINSEYIKEQSKQNKGTVFHKKGVVETYEKYQSGASVKEQISSQPTSGSRSRRSCSTASVSRQRKILPSYQQCGIKDIMEYHHAGRYRDVAVTEKCTKNSAESRFHSYSQIHDFDFRKRVHQLM